MKAHDVTELGLSDIDEWEWPEWEEFEEYQWLDILCWPELEQ